jgi:glycosyltransferase 2 family protein
VGIGSLYQALLHIRVEYLILAFICYFGINVFFTIRLRRVLAREDIKTTFGRTLLAQYAGMLTSDVTPGRSGYILTPLYLRDQDVPTSKSLSGILSIQTIEFMVKVIGGIGAIILLVKLVPAANWLQFGTFAGVNLGLIIAVLGVALMATGAAILAAVTWSKRAISLFYRIANWRFLKKFTGGILGKFDEYRESSQKNRKAIPEIVMLTMVCWVLKGFEWYLLALALGVSFGLSPVVTWAALFLIHPLVTALAFVPITPAGAGVQEFGIVGIFGLLVTSPTMAGPIVAFAILARGLLIIEDLVGVPQIVKTTSMLMPKKPETKANNVPATK